MKKWIAALVSLLLPLAAHAQGITSSADPRATEAGRAILRQGGSAADAAMAMMLALTVVEPQSSGVGGGGFFVYHDARTGRIDTIDGREKAPAAAKPGRFLGPDGKPLAFADAFPGGLSTGVPGNVRLLAMAHRKWGRLKWKALFQPAIRLARDGFTVTPPLHHSIEMMAPLWGKLSGPAVLYLDKQGQPLAVGARVRNPALARFLTRLAARGPAAFYAGTNAAAIVRATTTAPVNPGDMTPADLAAYQAKERPAVCARYRVYRVCGMGPPSSGGTTVLEILGMLEHFDLAKLGKDSPVAWHLIGEAMQLAYADRDAYLGDTDFVRVPLAGLIDPGYLSERARLIAPDHSLAAYAPGTPPGAEPRTAAVPGEVSGTTHFVAVDRAGDIATMTSTVEGPFGSQLVVNGYILNNELTDFTFAPEKDGAPVANRVAGGKRPLSSMSPTIVYDAGGRPIFTVGAAGGRTIIMQVLKTLVAHLDWGLSAQDALAEPVLFFNAAGLVLEPGTRLETMAPALEKLGHHVTVARLGFKANAAERTDHGWVGAADPRSVGTWAQE